MIVQVPHHPWPMSCCGAAVLAEGVVPNPLYYSHAVWEKNREYKVLKPSGTVHRHDPVTIGLAIVDGVLSPDWVARLTASDKVVEYGGYQFIFAKEGYNRVCTLAPAHPNDNNPVVSGSGSNTPLYLFSMTNECIANTEGWTATIKEKYRVEHGVDWPYGIMHADKINSCKLVGITYTPDYVKKTGLVHAWLKKQGYRLVLQEKFWNRNYLQRDRVTFELYEKD